MKNLILIFATGIIISTILAPSLGSDSDMDLYYESNEVVTNSDLMDESFLLDEIALDKEFIFENEDEGISTIDLSKELPKQHNSFN